MKKDELQLLADTVAEQEALLSFLLATVKNSMNYEEFRTSVTDNLSEVRINPTVNVDEYLDGFQDGYVITHKYLVALDDNAGTEEYETDYLRDDEGYPQVFSWTDVVPSTIKVVKVIDLEKRYAERNAKG